MAAKNEAQGVSEILSFFYRIEQRLNDLGPRRYSWEPPLMWLNRIENVVDQKNSLDIPRQLLDPHYRYRFDPQGLSADEKLQMTKLSASWLAEYHPKHTAPHNDRKP
jgi:hypothetical protein